MKRLMQIHRYLSCFVAPAMLFFAISGAWQAYRFHESPKNGSYTAPAAIKLLSEVHMAERLSGGAKPWFRAGQLLLAAAFVTTAIIGVVMGLRITRPTWRIWICLAAGVILPLLLTLSTRK